MPSGQSNFALGRIAATYGSFNSMMPMCPPWFPGSI